MTQMTQKSGTFLIEEKIKERRENRISTGTVRHVRHKLNKQPPQATLRHDADYDAEIPLRHVRHKMKGKIDDPHRPYRPVQVLRVWEQHQRHIPKLLKPWY